MTDHCPISERQSLNSHLYHHAKAPDDLRHLIVDISRAAKYISYAIKTTEFGLSGTVNQFGEEQQKLDVMSDDIVRHFLCESNVVNSYVSEEQEEVIDLELRDAPYAVVFDPLDGSSLIESNFAIGSIFGIYETKEILGMKPKEQVAALYIIYGPRTLLVYSTGKGVHTFILNDLGEFILLEENMGVADEAKNFAPGNLQSSNENEKYQKVVYSWDERLKLRYSGCMVADVHHILSKGQGIFAYPGSPSKPKGKLRLPFECGPFAYIMEQAGGAASDGKQPIMEKAIESIDQRTPIIIGSKKEVDKVVKML